MGKKTTVTGMRKARKKRRARAQCEKAVKEARCWRCGNPVGGEDARWFPAGDATIEIEYADGSFSGVFSIPLCDTCLCHPHLHSGENCIERLG
jgi:hypothetical protein